LYENPAPVATACYSSDQVVRSMGICADILGLLDSDFRYIAMAVYRFFF
jgi:hypothetical protein